MLCQSLILGLANRMPLIGWEIVGSKLAFCFFSGGPPTRETYRLWNA